MDADALHAGIDLEMNDGFLAETLCGAVDLLESFDRGGGEREIVLDEIGDLFFPDATEDEDGGVDAHLTQEDALFEDGDADIVGVRGKVTSDRIHSVTIGIGFENDHHFGRRDVRANGFEIIAKMREINFNVRGAQAVAGGDGGVVLSCMDVFYT